jgi:hypothetical protein
MNKLKLNSKGRFKVKNCPCGKSNKDGKFVPFEGHIKFGYCHACAETIQPESVIKSDFVMKVHQDIKREVRYISSDYVTKSIKRLPINNFVQFLVDQFGIDSASALVELYKIGDSKNWFGATIFWYLDKNNKARTGKIMLYNKETGKRVKQPYDHINWVHNKLKIPNESIEKCLFGEHLLGLYPDKAIAIVESEKTAVIASLFFPNFIWMATGGIGNLNYAKIKSLHGRKIMLFPDLCAYDKWLEKTKPLEKWFNLTVSDYLEKNASPEEKNQKYDLADYVLSLDRNRFFGSNEAC